MPQLTLMLRRTSIRLGEELGRGGEGVVFAVEEQSDWVAKIYASPPNFRKAQKLIVMGEAATPRLQQVAAWPIDLLMDSRETVCGFIMPRMDARKAIHELYSPKSRSTGFPKADFRFLVHAAANLARAFAVVHEQGHVLGDVNHGNVLVGDNGTVRLIDCDSFQIGRVPNIFPCDVGVLLFTAPELHGQPLRGLVRTANHDRFGLAVLLFHLLYMGRHPFAGRYSGPGEMPVEKAVREYRFAYGPDCTANAMDRPLGTVPLKTMGSGIARLFIHAFRRAGSNGVRPDAKSWIEELENLKGRLRVCWLDSCHYFPRELAVCPWCTVELQTGIRLFGQRNAPVDATGTIDALWKAIRAAPNPGADPALPSERPWQPPPGLGLPSRKLKNFRKALSITIGSAFAGLPAYLVPATDGGIAVAALAFCSLAGVTWPWVSSEEKIAANDAYQAALSKWIEVSDRWEQEATWNTFSKERRFLEDAHAEISELIGWRQRRDRNLQFNPSQVAHWREVEARIQELLLKLKQGPAELLRLSQEINATRARLMPTLEKAWDKLKIAEARRDAL